jgi:hypothetical protein
VAAVSETGSFRPRSSLALQNAAVQSRRIGRGWRAKIEAQPQKAVIDFFLDLAGRRTSEEFVSFFLVFSPVALVGQTGRRSP